MRNINKIVGAIVYAILTSGALADANPAVLFDLGGKFDKSFNESAWVGAERFRKETNVLFKSFELQSDAQREQALRRFASRSHNPVIVAGFSWGQAMKVVAAEFPDVNFTIIDSVVDYPNVQSVVFKEHEGSYLVGVLAAMASSSNKIGFVGGMDIPLVRAFACGYRQGAAATFKGIEVFENMTGTTGSAWSDPVKGGELARSQIGRGADVVYHAAGATGVGVLQASADAGVLGVGVDSNQNYLHPGSVLTSMLKRVDVAVYNAMLAEHIGEFKAGVSVLGLADGGVGLALDEHNSKLITPEMKERVDEVTDAIVSGETVVHDYRKDDTCPVN